MPNCLILSELFMSFAFGGQRYYFLTDFFLRLNSHKMGQIKKRNQMLLIPLKGWQGKPAISMLLSPVLAQVWVAVPQSYFVKLTKL